MGRCWQHHAWGSLHFAACSMDVEHHLSTSAALSSQAGFAVQFVAFPHSVVMGTRCLPLTGRFEKFAPDLSPPRSRSHWNAVSFA